MDYWIEIIALIALIAVICFFYIIKKRNARIKKEEIERKRLEDYMLKTQMKATYRSRMTGGIGNSNVSSSPITP